MMYPGFHWWRARHCGAVYGDHVGRHGFAERAWDERRATADRFGDGGGLGVRRPLRFLAWKLDLDERQVSDLAKVLAELKTERAQAEVDGRRATAALADAIAGEQFDQQRATEGGALRVGSAEHLRDAVLKALGRIHSLLEPEQRERLAYLIRTGTLQI
jgi:Spy/CpxP family protein refolding chaperone